MLNTSCLIGRLTKEPEVKVLPSGQNVCNFTVAVERSFKNKDGEREADFIPVIAWGKTAELAGNYLAKGRQVGLKGRIQTRNYEATDGTKKYITEVVAEELSFLGSNNSNNNNSNVVANNNSNNEFGVSMDGFEEYDDDDMPF